MRWRSLYVPLLESVSDPASTVQVEGVHPATRANPSEPPPTDQLGATGSDEHLHDPEAFRRFVGQVTLCAPRWLAQRSVPPADREDVLQEALLQAFKRRRSYDPAAGTWEGWAFGVVGRVVLNYRKVTMRRRKRVDVATAALPDIAVGGPTPEEETEATMMQALFDKCMAGLDAESRALLLARAEGQMWGAIATAFGVSIATARRHYDDARRKLQAALDHEQNRDRALGALVVPVTIDQLLASDATTGDVTAEAMGRIWEMVERAIKEEVAGNVGADRADGGRSVGSPNTAPRLPLGARVMRALGPRGLSALTHLAAAGVSAVVTYAFLKADPAHSDTALNAGAVPPSMIAHAGYSRDPDRAELPAPSAERRAGAVEEPERRADAGAAERTGAGSGPRGAARDDIAGETSLFDLGSTSYQSGHYADAIRAFREHARKYPRGQFSDPRDRLLTLALIHAGRRDEARQRVEGLRQTHPESPHLDDFDRAMKATDP